MRGRVLIFSLSGFLFLILGIVEKDPKLPDTVIMAPPPQRTTESVFDQEEKAKVSMCVCLLRCVTGFILLTFFSVLIAVGQIIEKWPS